MKMYTYTNCLSFDQLKAHALNKSNASESAQTYKHISSCELCACALNGFAAIPFSFSDVAAICHQVDLNTNASKTNLLILARAILVVLSIAGIFGFYSFANSFYNNTAKVDPLERSSQVVSPVIKNGILSSVLSANKDVKLKTERKRIRPFSNSLFRNVISVDPIENITVSLVEPDNKMNTVIKTEFFNADVIYIYDLKVTHYQNFYFNCTKLQFENKSGTPSFRENQKNQNNFAESDITHTIAADIVLRNGLAYFNKGKYSKAINEFQLLLDFIPNDVNALFYSGVSFYQIGKYGSAIKNLEAVLKNENNVFHPEAKWNLALVNLKLGNKLKAKELLNEIAFEKGFYSKKASEKLKGLSF